jgi:hypothetical protein
MHIHSKKLAAATLLLSWCLACSSQAPSIAGSAPVALGLPCAVSASCSSGQCIPETQTPSGVSWTAGTCSQACAAQGTCPAAAACVSFADGSSWCLPPCRQTSECRQGYICSGAVGACLPDCRLGFSCGTSLGCDQLTGACVPGSQQVGSACSLDADCQSALCSPEQATAAGKQWAGGYCTQACAGSAPCPSGSSCVTYDDGSAYCASACGTSADCRSGYACSATAKVCLPDCRQGWSCGAFLTCDGATGTCVVGPLQVGAPCTTSTDCGAALCTPAQSTSSGTAWNGGYCTTLCSSSAPCPAPAKCVAYADGASCAAACTTNEACRAGYVCAASVGACLPDCRQGWDCGAQLTCDAATGACL